MEVPAKGELSMVLFYLVYMWLTFKEEKIQTQVFAFKLIGFHF